MEPKLLNFWETGVCGDLTGGMWDWTTQKVTSRNTQFNIIYIMRIFVWSYQAKGGQIGSQAKTLASTWYVSGQPD